MKNTLGALLALAITLVAPTVHAQTAAPPWAAAATTEVVETQMKFASRGAVLSGTLYAPRTDARVPAIVVTHGASSPLRTSPLYRHLKEMLPQMGYAVFVYDRRGSGQSGGDLKASDYPMLADDARAAVRMLQGDRRIDRKRIGIWGLSQGGWLSLLAAARGPEAAFVVAVSAPIVTADVQMVFSSINSLRINGYDQAEIDQMVATRKAVDDYMRGTGTQVEAQRRVDQAKSKPWFKLLYMGEKITDRETSRWRREIEHDPMATLDKVRVPTLVIYGSVDPVVPVTTSMQRLIPKAAENPKLQVAVIAGADHDMQLSVSPKDQMDPARGDTQAPEAPAYFGLLASWLAPASRPRHPGTRPGA